MSEVVVLLTGGVGGVLFGGRVGGVSFPAGIESVVFVSVIGLSKHPETETAMSIVIIKKIKNIRLL